MALAIQPVKGLGHSRQKLITITVMVLIIMELFYPLAFITIVKND